MQQASRRKPKPTTPTAPLDFYVQVGGLMLATLVLIALPDWIMYGASSAWNSIPLVPKIEAARPEQQSQTSSPQSDVVRVRQALIQQESGGDARAVNRSGSGATGLGQVMPENISAWSREILGREVSRPEFINNPDLQLQIIDGKLQQYWDQAIKASGGNKEEAVKRVASAWYSGNPNSFNSTRPQYWAGNRYSSIADYSASVLQRWEANE